LILELVPLRVKKIQAMPTKQDLGTSIVNRGESSLLYVFVLSLGLDHAQNTIVAYY